MRFTPAHAGNTHVNAEEAGSLEVHPRSRGEYLLTLHQTDPEPGSSPLTRGIRGPKPENVEKARFIPAHAGNTTGSSNGTRRTQVHPRSRGEYRGVFFIPFFNTGSSPLTRGILFEKVGAIGVQRFIPAHAGNTCLNSSRTASKKVHPRSRGEYGLLSVLLSRYSGSSPLTRGIHRLILQTDCLPRFIPAHAGNT